MLRATMAAPRTKTKASGFTIVEIMIVITIAAVLATVVLPGLVAQNQDKLVVRMTEDFNTLQQAILVYYTQNPWPDCEPVSQSTLKNDGFLGQVLADPWGTNYQIKGVDDNGCQIRLRTKPGAPPSNYNTPLMTGVSGLNCFVQNTKNRCEKFLTESMVFDPLGGSSGEGEGETISLDGCIEQVEDLCTGTIRSVDCPNNKVLCCPPFGILE